MNKLIDIYRLKQSLERAKDYTDNKEVDTSDIEKKLDFLFDFLGVEKNG